MCLTRNEKLHRTIRISEDAHQPLRIVEQQCWPFIGREPPRETERQRLWIENPRGLLAHFGQAPIEGVAPSAGAVLYASGVETAAAGDSATWRLAPGAVHISIEENELA